MAYGAKEEVKLGTGAIGVAVGRFVGLFIAIVVDSIADLVYSRVDIWFFVITVTWVVGPASCRETKAENGIGIGVAVAVPITIDPPVSFAVRGADADCVFEPIASPNAVLADPAGYAGLALEG